jgi:hypothetical protein
VLLTDYLLSVEVCTMDGSDQGHSPIVFDATSTEDPALCTVDICVVTSKLESNKIIASPGSVSTSLSASPRTPNHSGSSQKEERVDLVLRIHTERVYHATRIVRIDLDDSRKLFRDNNDNVPSKPPSLCIVFESCIFRIFSPNDEIHETQVNQHLRPALAKLMGVTSHTTDPLALEGSLESGWYREITSFSERSVVTVKQSNQTTTTYGEEPIAAEMKRKVEHMTSSWESLQAIEDLLYGPPSVTSASAAKRVGEIANASANHLSASWTTATNLCTAHEALDHESVRVQEALEMVAAAFFPPPRRAKASPTKQSQEHPGDWQQHLMVTKQLMDSHAEAVKTKHALAVTLLVRN